MNVKLKLNPNTVPGEVVCPSCACKFTAHVRVERRKLDREMADWNEQLTEIHRSIARMNAAVLTHYLKEGDLK